MSHVKQRGRSAGAWKEDASANEVARWFELQDGGGGGGISKGGHALAAVLESISVPKPAVPRPQSALSRRQPERPEASAARRPQSARPSASRAPARPPSPAPTLQPRWTSVPEALDAPPAPPSTTTFFSAPAQTRWDRAENDENATPVPSPTDAAAASSPKSQSQHSRREVSAASAAAAVHLGVDPHTGQPNTVSYAGFQGIQTHYQETFGAMSDPTNAKLLAPVLAIARPDPVPNQAFQSAYGDSLKQSAGALKKWTANCMQTSKQAFDAPVAAKAATVSSVGEDKIRQRENFHKHNVGSRLYYGDLLGEEAAAAVDAKLMAAGAEEREVILSAFRDVHAGTAYQRDQRVSVSHEQYREGFRPSEVDAARRHETTLNRSRLTGPGVPPRVAAARRTRRAEIRAAATAEKDRLYAIVDGKRAAAVAAKAVSGVCCDPAKMESRETFKSQFKIGWMSSAAVQPAEMSSYQDLQCGNHVQVLAALKAGVDEGSAGSSHKYHPITAPYGDVNYLGREEPARAYPVPKYLTKRRPASAGGAVHTATTSRVSFQPRGQDAMVEQARQAKEAAAASRSMRGLSTIPLGAQGLMDHPRHQKSTAYQLDYAWHGRSR